MTKTIYLDNHSTTSCDPAVLQRMLPYFLESYGNASSDHLFGQTARDAVSLAQKQVASLISCGTEEIYFTSGATESNNLAILGTASSNNRQVFNKKRIVSTKIEHKSVLAPLEQLQKDGWEICYLPLDRYGQIDLGQAERIINEDTLLVSVQAANSEIGTIQPISQLSAISQRNNALLHCDASQALGKIPLKVDDLGVDFLSLSGHKIYGPKGVGVLWIKNGYPKILKPLMYGGRQTNGIRPGTLPVPLIVGFGTSCELAEKNFLSENRRVSNLRDSFEQQLKKFIPGLFINGAVKDRLSNNSNITFPNVDAETLLANIPEIVASTGSACESGSVDPSRILLEIGLSREDAFNTIRFGFGRFNMQPEVEYAADVIVQRYNDLAMAFQ